MIQAAAQRHPLDGAHWCLVRATGEVDLAAAPELARVLQAVSTHESGDQHGSDHQHGSGHHVVLDLAAVTFLDCSGVRPLVDARRRLADRFWLANPPAQVTRLLALAGLADVFAVLDGLPSHYAVRRAALPAPTMRESGSRPGLPAARTHGVGVQRAAAASRS